VILGLAKGQLHQPGKSRRPQMAPMDSKFSQMDQALGQMLCVFGCSPIR
jgi:hypothetical protein